jgi:hypothetical protein
MKLNLVIHEARNLLPADFNGFSDPYCVINISGEEFRTKVKKKTLNPNWEETFTIDIRESGYSSPSLSVGSTSSSELQISIFDHDLIGKHEFLGQVVIADPKSFPSKWCTLESRRGKKDKVKGEILIEIVAKEEGSSNTSGMSNVLGVGKKKTVYRLVKRNKLDELKKAIEVGCLLSLLLSFFSFFFPFFFSFFLSFFHLILSKKDPEVNVDAKNHRENTALHYAARQGSIEFITILTQHHADVSYLPKLVFF